MATRRCMCDSDACGELGRDATLRLPSEETARSAWLSYLRQDKTCALKDPRVSLSHFRSEDVIATRDTSAGSVVRLSVRTGALPSRSDDGMRASAVGSVQSSMRWEAVANRKERVSAAALSRVHELDEEVLRWQGKAEDAGAAHGRRNEPA